MLLLFIVSTILPSLLLVLTNHIYYKREDTILNYLFELYSSFFIINITEVIIFSILGVNYLSLDLKHIIYYFTLGLIISIFIWGTILILKKESQY